MSYTIFTGLEEGDDVRVIRGTEVTTGLWSGDTGSLTTIESSSNQINVSGEFYYDLYNGNPDTSDVQFSVAYGHRAGSGSPSLSTLNTSTLPTQVIYSQYRNLLLGKDQEKFTFGDIQSDDIYVINIQRARLRQVLDPGNWQLGLRGTSGFTSTFIDNSALGTATTGNLIANAVYNVRSGSLTDGVVAANTTVYGLVFPDSGIIILHPGAIRTAIGMTAPASLNRSAVTTPFAPYTASAASTVSSYQRDHEGLVRAIKLAMNNSSPFIARSAEAITSTNYFIRLRNYEFNYSNNPTYSTSSANQKTPLPAFVDKPITYPTTVGLYNDQNELLAVAKLSRPIQKSIDKEALIRVRLDF